MRPRFLCGILVLAVLLSGCVSQKKYDALMAERDALAQEREELLVAAEALRQQLAEAEKSAEALRGYVAEQSEEISRLQNELHTVYGLSEAKQKTIDELTESLQEAQQKILGIVSGGELQQAVEGASESAQNILSGLGSMFSNFKLRAGG